MTDETLDPAEQAGRAILDLIDQRRASREHAAGLFVPREDAAGERAASVPGGLTAAEQEDLDRRKAEHAAAVAEREAAIPYTTGAAVGAPETRSPNPAEELLRSMRGRRG